MYLEEMYYLYLGYCGFLYAHLLDPVIDNVTLYHHFHFPSCEPRKGSRTLECSWPEVQCQRRQSAHKKSTFPCDASLFSSFFPSPAPANSCLIMSWLFRDQGCFLPLSSKHPPRRGSNKLFILEKKIIDRLRIPYTSQGYLHFEQRIKMFG